MTQYSLTERQKDMLRSIVPGLQDGSIFPECIYMIAYGQVQQILSLGPDSKSTHIHWESVMEADFADFEREGLLKWTRGSGQGSLLLYSQKIINGVKSNFGENEQEVSNPSSKFEPIFGTPSSDHEFKCDVFMIMPFAEEFESIYRDYIKPTVEDLGLVIKRGDDFFSRHDIINEIWSAIYASKIVIADCTGRNPNVFYELGIAHTLGKITVLITQNINDAPFDVQGKRFIVYQDNSAGLKVLRDKLKEYVSKAAKK